MFLGAGTVDNGQIGNIGARISGGQNGVEIAGAGVVSNDGTITGVASDAVYLGSGTVTNGEIGDLTALISGGPADSGVWIGAGIGIVGNFGTITSAGTMGVLLAGGGTLTNGAPSDTAALISGPVDGVVFGNLGSLFNYGTIQANGGGATVIGAFLGNGGTIENLSAASMISGLEWGAVVEGASGSVTNLGIIQASAASGVGVHLVAGGTVVNGLATGSTATIFGGSDGVWIAAGAPGAGAVVQNNGTIGGLVGVGFEGGLTAAAGTLTNNGLIQSTSGTSGYAVVFGAGAERLVLQSAGAFIGHVLGNNATGSSTTLELASGTQGTLSGLTGPGPSNDGGTVTDSAGSFVFAAFGTIALDAGAAWAVSAPGTLDTLNNAGTLSISGGLVTVNGTVNGTGGLLQIGNGGTIQLDQAVSGQTIKFLTSGGSIGVLDIADFGGFDNTQVIQNFVAGDQIIVGTTAAATFSQSGSLVSVMTNSSTLGVLTFDSMANATTAMGGLVDQVLPCFAAGTRIATERGEVAVEDLRAGDRLRVLLGDELAPVIWVGQRQVNCARHSRPRQVWPVRVLAGAFGPGRPHRDLLLSPDHAVYVNDVLIPVKYLINDSTIAQVPMDTVTYYHVELACHDVLLAEGLPAESYLDVDDRGNFDNGGAVVRMHPDFATRVWEAEGCAELVVTGPVLDGVRARLATIAAAERQAVEPAVPIAA